MEAHASELDLVSVLSNPQMWAALINFAVLVGIFTWAIRKKVNPALAQKRAEVAKQLAEAQQLKEEAARKREEYQRRLANLDQEVAQIRAELVHAGQAERDRIVAEAEQKSARMRKDAQFLIEQRIKQLREDLIRQTTDEVLKAADQLLREKTTPADQQRLADQYLVRLKELTSEAKS